MPRLAAITEVSPKIAGQPKRTVHVNPANVTIVEEAVDGGTRIVTNDGHSFQTAVGMDAVVLLLNQARL